MRGKTAFLIVLLSFALSNALGSVVAEGLSPAGILDSQKPIVTVTFPNGSEVFQIGDPLNITWTALDSSFGTNPISIYYSIDNGASYALIAENLPNTGTFGWTIPNSPSLEVLVKIAAADSFGLQGNDVSDAVFKIDGPPEPPQNVQLALSDHAILLNWSASLEGDVNRYAIYRATSAGVLVNSTNALDTISSAVTSFTDSAVVHGITYYYVVTALDSMNNQSLASGEVNGTAYILQVLAVSFKQRTDGSKMVDITYDLQGNPNGTYEITPFVRLNALSEWVALVSKTGAVGGGITAGTNKQIVWNLYQDLGEVYSGQAQIKILATEENLSKSASAAGRRPGS